jgi:UDP-glucose 4-epimerase
MRVLITGGAGFIGSAIARRLLAEGHTVRIFDNLETGAMANVPVGAEFVAGDVRSALAVGRAARGCDAIAHQAAMVSVTRSIAEPARCYDVNVVGTRNVLEAARQAGCMRVALASSAAVYGNAPSLPKREALPARPESPYAESKWLNEVDARYYGGYMGVETVCLRYFNVFGPHQRPDSPYSGVISIAASRLLADAPFTVFGTGAQTRDFVYVEDVARAVAAALTRPDLGHEVINVGRGERVSLLELLRLMGEAVGRKPRLRFDAPRPGDVLHSLADVSRMGRLLGVRAEVPLDAGLAATIDWMAGTADLGRTVA